MMRTPAFVAVDWGTTNRRAYRLDETGRTVEEIEEPLGILSVPAGGFPAAVKSLTSRWPGLPLLMGGMVGSNRGWVEAPYAPAPAGLDELAAAVKWVEPGRIGIVPGVSFEDGVRADVMRGEEVQVAGAVAAGAIPPDALVCHPGTHNKWIEVKDGRIATFRTVMSGELFALLAKHSILSDLLAGDAGMGPAFDAGVDHGLTHDDLPAELFAVRARFLLGKAPRGDAAPYVSGLLIGNDIRIGLGRERHDAVHVLGRPELTRLFAAALVRAGRNPVEVDGEAAFLEGMRRIIERAP